MRSNNNSFDIVSEDGIEYISQHIRFEPEILNEYYVGDAFIGIKAEKHITQEKLDSMMEEGDMNGFMPQLVSELKEVMGVDNIEYDGYCFGTNENGTIGDISLIFLINKKQYKQVMDKINYWSISKGIDWMMSFDIKKQ